MDKQEPVAWMHNHIADNIITHKPADLDRNPDRWTALYKDPTPCKTCEALARTVMMDQTSHDTKKEWVGLTDKDREWCDEHSHGNTSGAKQKAYGRAIEAKLKEKNT